MEALQMKGIVELVGKPLLVHLIQQFFEAIIRARDMTTKFDVVLSSLESTVTLVTPKIIEIIKMDQEHDNYLKQEIIVFCRQLNKGQALVDTCAEIPRWNKYKRYKYAKRLAEMDSSLRKLLEVQFQAEQVLYNKKMLSEMAAINKKLDRMNIQKPAGVSGGGKSSNAAAADQPRDDQTAGRRPRFEVHIRRKKGNDETDFKLSSGRRPRVEMRFRRKTEKGETDVKLSF